jgi:hypothetical protein
MASIDDTDKTGGLETRTVATERGDRNRTVAQQVIEALRRGGLGCCLVTPSDEPTNRPR